MPYLTNARTKLYWNQRGSGPPLLLIMGLSFTHEMWFRLLPALEPRYRLIAFDNRGMGRSEVPKGPYTIAQMASDAAAVLDAAGVASAHVLGASMGGMIAQELALERPERVLSLALACTSYSGLFARWPQFRYGPRRLRWSEMSRREREAALIPLLYADATPRERIEEDFEIRLQCNWCYKGFLNQLLGILMWSSYRRLPRIAVPTIVVHGDQDRLVPPENGRVIAARVPGARFYSIPNAGHVMLTDQPEICTEVILEFLDKQPKT